MKITWTRTALASLQELLEHVREQAGEQREQALANSIIGKAQQLSAFPESGPVDSRFQETPFVVRRLPIEKNYRLLYTILQASAIVQILLVEDVRRNSSHVLRLE